MKEKELRIALIGKMRSGKDSVGGYLVGTKGFQRFAFGTGIKRVVQLLYPEVNLLTKPRKLYQKIGQKLREFDPVIWINYLDYEVERWVYSAKKSRPDLSVHIVVTDVRQMNEVKYLKEQGYLLVKVETDEGIRLQRIKDAGDDYSEEDLCHETEIAVDTLPYDYLITNNGTLEELQIQAEQLYQEVRK
ncbi:hypothetical protein CN613_25470 [Bacillus pseudomycoides]|uniref:Dephospho-CoA kinase n=1 Tax=Bacillus pseudomycoides TaxID=64104 RepID=A0A2A8BYL8_9BACI|nr:hypothetical protein [Bacillus pseudomycoides]PEM65297.1 hypothetical protein CN613_25470 [Bacillus pseudomycoides]